MRKLLKGGTYSREETIRRNTVFNFSRFYRILIHLLVRYYIRPILLNDQSCTQQGSKKWICNAALYKTKAKLDNVFQDKSILRWELAGTLQPLKHFSSSLPWTVAKCPKRPQKMYLKVSKFPHVFFVSSITPKKRTKTSRHEAS